MLYRNSWADKFDNLRKTSIFISACWEIVYMTHNCQEAVCRVHLGKEDKVWPVAYHPYHRDCHVANPAAFVAKHGAVSLDFSHGLGFILAPKASRRIGWILLSSIVIR
jgi:hypothetical protein